MSAAGVAPPRAAALGIYRGWLVVGAAFALLFIGFGIAYSFTIFFHPLQSQFHASRADVSLVFAISGSLYLSLGAVSGYLADRLGPKWVAVAGMLLMGLGLLLASRANALWQVDLTYGAGVGLGIGFVYAPAMGAVQRWFIRRRGFASGLAVSGIGVGTLVGPPAAAWIIDRAGWRGTYGAMAAVAVVAGCGAAMLLEHSPQRRGLLPDNLHPHSAEHAAVVAAHWRGATVREALRSHAFWMLYAACTLTSFGIGIPLAHMVPYVRDRGLPEATGVMMLGLVGIGSTGGRFALGASADWLGRRQSLILAFAGMAAILLWWLPARTVISLGIFALAFGLFYGGFVALTPAITMDIFGGHQVSTILGLLYTGSGIGTLLGPTLAGMAYDHRHSYTLPVVAAALGNLASAWLMWNLRDSHGPAHTAIGPGI